MLIQRANEQFLNSILAQQATYCHLRIKLCLPTCVSNTVQAEKEVEGSLVPFTRETGGPE